MLIQKISSEVCCVMMGIVLLKEMDFRVGSQEEDNNRFQNLCYISLSIQTAFDVDQRGA